MVAKTVVEARTRDDEEAFAWATAARGGTPEQEAEVGRSIGSGRGRACLRLGRQTFPPSSARAQHF